MKEIVLIGYSGHAYVVFETFFSQGQIVSAYAESEEKEKNPYALKWLGNEADRTVLEKLRRYSYFVSVGNNTLRSRLSAYLVPELGNPVNAIHKTSVISRSVSVGHGMLIAPGVIINAQVKIGNGVICNTGSIIEHECTLADFVHVAPGATLCGNVSIGKGAFIGANSVIKEGVKIGQNAIIGAGTVVIKDVNDNQKVVGNPQRCI